MLVSEVTFWESPTCVSVAVSMSDIQMRIILSSMMTWKLGGKHSRGLHFSSKMPNTTLKIQHPGPPPYPITRQKDWQNPRFSCPLAKVQFYVYVAFYHLWFLQLAPGCCNEFLPHFHMKFCTIPVFPPAQWPLSRRKGALLPNIWANKH